MMSRIVMRMWTRSGKREDVIVHRLNRAWAYVESVDGAWRGVRRVARKRIEG